MDPRLQQVMADLFDLSPHEITTEMAMQDVELWDSIKHLELVTTLEATFGVTFDIDDIPTLTNVRAIAEALGQ